MALAGPPELHIPAEPLHTFKEELFSGYTQATMNRKRGKPETSAQPTSVETPAPTDTPAKRLRAQASIANPDSVVADVPKVGRAPATRRRQALLAHIDATAGTNSSRGNSSSSPSEVVGGEHTSMPVAAAQKSGLDAQPVDKHSDDDDDQQMDKDQHLLPMLSEENQAKSSMKLEDKVEQELDGLQAQPQTLQQSPLGRKQRKGRPPAVTLPETADSGELIPVNPQLDTSRCLVTMASALHSPRLLFQEASLNGNDQSTMLEQLIMAPDMTDPSLAMQHLQHLTDGPPSPSNHQHADQQHLQGRVSAQGSDDMHLGTSGNQALHGRTRRDGAHDTDHGLLSLGTSDTSHLNQFSMLVSPRDSHAGNDQLILDTPHGSSQVGGDRAQGPGAQRLREDVRRDQLPRVSDMGDMSPTGTMMSDGQRWHNLWMQTQREVLSEDVGVEGHGREGSHNTDDLPLMPHPVPVNNPAPTNQRHWRDLMMGRGDMPKPLHAGNRVVLDGLDPGPAPMPTARTPPPSNNNNNAPSNNRPQSDEAMRLAAAEDRAYRLEDQLRNERHENQQLRQKLAQAEKDVFQLSRQNLDIEDKFSAMKQQRDAAMREMGPLQARMTDMQRERGRILKEFAEDRRALQVAQDEIRKLQSALASAGPGTEAQLQAVQAQLEAERKGALAVMAAASQLQRKYRMLQAVAEERDNAVHQLQAMLDAREMKDGGRQQEQQRPATPNQRAMATLQADVSTLTRDNAALRQALEETIKGHQELLKHLALTARGQGAAQAVDVQAFPSQLLQLARGAVEQQEGSANASQAHNGQGTPGGNSALLPVWPLSVPPPPNLSSPSDAQGNHSSNAPTSSPKLQGLNPSQAQALAAALQGGDNELVNSIVGGPSGLQRLVAAAAANNGSPASVSAAQRIALAAAAARNSSMPSPQSQEQSADAGSQGGDRAGGGSAANAALMKSRNGRGQLYAGDSR